MMRYLLLLIGLFLFISCKKETSNKVNLHHDYFGIEKGRYIVYDVKEVNHLSNNNKDTIEYQLKTVIGDTVHDNAGRVGNKYMRYTRNLSTDNWVLKDVWFIILADNRGELVEENERIVKMVFAPTSDKAWNANNFNTLGAVEYSYDDLHTPFQISGIHMDSTVKVVQEDVFNLIQWRKKHEIYAKNIGMVKKHYQHYNISNFDVQNISTGKELYMNMIQYGFE